MVYNSHVARGVRNRNPANIRKSNIEWLGLAPIQTDKSFCQFTKFKYGIRALIKLLHTYYYKHDLHTIRGILSRYAPPFENNTDAYINFVCNRAGFNADYNLEFYDVVWRVVPAICLYESDFKLPHSILVRVVNEFHLL